MCIMPQILDSDSSGATLSASISKIFNLLKLSTAKRKLETLEENNTVALYNQVKMNRNTIKQ